MSRRVIFATGNEGKMREIRMILDNPDLQVLSMNRCGYRGGWKHF